jgi:hypothetical protein
MRTFKCDFGNKLTCEIKVTDKVPEKGTSHVQKIVWSGRPTRADILVYITWMNSVNQLLANEWGVNLMHVFQTEPGWRRAEVWLYRPGTDPEFVESI